MRAIRAFREDYLTSDVSDAQMWEALGNFESLEARQLRYAMLWAYFEGTAYRELHQWVTRMKSVYGLYKFVRDIYNPTYRIATFHQGHIWGGELDLEAGDGLVKKSSIPIKTDDEAVRLGISTIWKSSRWHQKKDIVCLHGTVFGDTFLKIVDDPQEGDVFIEVIPPYEITDLEKDRRGNVVRYEQSYPRPDPGFKKTKADQHPKMVMYTEVAEATGSQVVYTTYKDQGEYGWDGNPSTWMVQIPFIPLVPIMHNDVGSVFGWPEIFPALSKFRELDDQASKLGDHIRKMVDPVWLFAGVKKPQDSSGESTITIAGPGGNPIAREEMPVIFTNEPTAKGHALVADLNIEAGLQHVSELLLEVERTFPELRTVMLAGGGSGDVSGRALLVARQSAEEKVLQRRRNYDSGLITAHKMALAIGAAQGYDGFPKGTLEDFEGDRFRHEILERAVFHLYPAEALEQGKAFWINAYLAQRVGVSLEIFLREQGWDPDRITAVLGSDEYKLRQALMEVQLFDPGADFANNGGGSEGGQSEGDIGVPSSRAILQPGKPGSDFALNP